MPPRLNSSSKALVEKSMLQACKTGKHAWNLFTWHQHTLSPISFHVHGQVLSDMCSLQVLAYIPYRLSKISHSLSTLTRLCWTLPGV